MVWTAIIGSALLALMTIDYVRIRLSSQSYQALLRESVQQKETLKQYEGSIGELQGKVKGFEDKIKNLNLMAGFKSPEKLENPGVGDYPRDAQGLPIPSSQISLGNIQTIQQKTDDIQKNLDTLSNFFESQSARLATTPTIKPIEGGLITSSFGWRKDPFTGKQAYHYGIDLLAAWGNPVIAPADGTVVKISNDIFYGKSILISHGRGISTLYGHLSKITVREGQRVIRGEVIGNVGNTGKALGPHLHYEVHVNDKPVNPYFYLLDE